MTVTTHLPPSKPLQPPFNQKQKILSKTSPPFTLKDLRSAIPPHCFQPSFRESFLHLAKDLAEISLYVIIMLWADERLYALSPWLWGAAWGVYTWVQGVVMTGLWILAHECGHGAFSPNQMVNDVIGFLCHTMLSIPYYSWQHTHANHHHHTNHLLKDAVFVPKKKSEAAQTTSVFNYLPKNAFVSFAYFLFISIFGWPIYLLTNATGAPLQGFANHFLPSSALFPSTMRTKVHLSTLGLLCWYLLLGSLSLRFSPWLILRLYLLPLLVTNAFLIAITLLQHTDPHVPHYDESEWTWLRGALCTVDRTMGPYLDHKLHLIHVTHVLHHIFPRIPFYRSEEATEAIQKVLGEYRQVKKGSFFRAVCETVMSCEYLEEGKGSLFWLAEM